MSEKFHVPVMRNEVIQFLNLRPGQVIVDATVGTGGHSIHILEKIMPGGRLIAIDRDEGSLEVARRRLGCPQSGACEFVHGNFMEIDRILEGLRIKEADGVLFDLGVSSYQLEDATRGFSFQQEGPLDMRLDRESYISAYDLVNNLNKEEISEILWSFGQERWHNRIAQYLVREREKSPITSTLQLSRIVASAVPYRYRHQRIHPATRTFQAIRIAVNRELESLKAAIEKTVGILARSGRICVISFHSLEDRIVKFGFRQYAAERKLKIITPKPLTPAREEVSANPASRSAKLRVAEKL